MNKFQTLLTILVKDLNREYLEEQQTNLCKHICSDILQGTVNPNELKPKTLKIVFEDNSRYFIQISMKKGFNITVPVTKGKFHARSLSSKLYINRK